VNKFEIRKKIFKIRKQYYSKNLEINFEYIFKILKKNNTLSKIIGGYYPYNYEVDAIKILEKFEKLGYEISLPKIKNNSQMDFFRWSPKDPLSINKYGIPEPTSDKIVYPGILLVPLVAYDKHCNRLGYGGGFYDRYIKKRKKNKKIVTIGLAYSFQKVRQVPINKHDMRLNYIATNKQI
jgi:5-formyltetrahydrofolate cyclo-ligase